MKNSLETLQALIDNKIIDIQDYYVTTLVKWDVALQGKFNSKLIQRLTEVHGVDFKVKEQGFVEGELRYQSDNADCKVTFTFTS